MKSDLPAGLAKGGLEDIRKSASTAPVWATLIATVFGVGRLRPGPGTWGSAVTVLFWWVLTQTTRPAWHTLSAIFLAIVVVGIGIPAAAQVSRATGSKDPQFIVIDEVAGQLIAFIAVPASWKSLLLGFILFRGFDIVKPPPVRNLERLPEGYGIVIDDVGAGIYACLVMHALLHFGILPR